MRIPIKYQRTYMVIKWRNGVKLERKQSIPVCRHLLTGLHERTVHFQRYLRKIAANAWAKETLK